MRNKEQDTKDYGEKQIRKTITASTSHHGTCWLSQGGACARGGLKENGLLRLIHWSMWSPEGGTVGEGLGRCSLDGGQISLRDGSGVPEAHIIPSVFSLPVCELPAPVRPMPTCPACCHVPHRNGHGLTMSNCKPQINSFFL